MTPRKLKTPLVEMLADFVKKSKSRPPFRPFPQIATSSDSEKRFQ